MPEPTHPVVTPMTRMRVFVLASAVLTLTIGWLSSAQQALPDQFAGTLYLRSGAGDLLDSTLPVAGSPSIRDSQPLDRSTFQPLGTWSTGPAGAQTELQEIGPFAGWLGLVDGGDRGLPFELRVEVLRNSEIIASGTSDGQTGLQPPGGRMSEVSVPIGPIADRTFGPGDVLSLRLLARIGRQGRPNAVGRLRVYYDAANAAAGIRARLTSSNNPPIANAGPDQTVVVGQVTTLDGSASTDADGDPLTFRWTFISRPAGSQATLSDSTAVNPSFAIDQAGSYTVRLIVNDGKIDSATDIVIVSTSNSRPVANAGIDRTAVVGSTVMLDGSGSSDPDGDALTYQWSLVSRPAASAATLQNPASIGPSFVLDTAGEYVVRLVVNDGALDSDAAEVTVSTINSPPVAHAGPGQSAFIGELITLDGSASTDVDGNLLTYRWTFVSRPDGSDTSLQDPVAVNPRFVIDRFGVYIVQLIVNDGSVDSAPSTVTISTLNSPPTANAGLDQRVSVGMMVQLDGTASSDPDGNLLTFAWSIISRPQASQAMLSSASVVDPVLTVDAAGTYVLQLIVNDGSVNSSPATVTISTDNRPPVANAGSNQVVAPNVTVQLDGSGSSDPDGDVLTYAWALLSRPAGSVAALSDATIVDPTFVADRPGVYVAQLIVNDGERDSPPATVTITTSNAAPVADAGTAQTVIAGSTVQLDGSASFDPDGTVLSYAWSLMSVPTSSAASISNPTIAGPTFVADRRGTYVAQLTVSDGLLVSAPATVTITSTNRVPVAAGDSATTPMNTATVVNVLANDTDADGDALTVTSVSSPANGSAIVNPGNTITYTPANGFVGGDAFTYVIADGEGGTASASVTVTVNSVAACLAPVINGIEPPSGPVGTEVIVIGENLDCGNTQNLTLNDTELVITGASPTQLKTFVPIGSAGGTIVLITDGGSTSSASPFTVTRSQQFVLMAVPATAKVVQGSFTTYFVEVSGSFTGLAALSTSGLPPGASASFSPILATSGQNVTLTLATGEATPLGLSSFEIHAAASIDASPIIVSKPLQTDVLPRGVTALAGRVLDTDGRPIRNVTTRLGGMQSEVSAITDEGGNFLVLDAPAGEQLLLIDGQTASDETHKYPTIPLTVTIVEGIVNRLTFQPFLHAQRNVNFTAIDPQHETIVTDPDLPGVVMRIPAGVQIIGWDGERNERVSIRSVPVDRLPIPAPQVDALTNTVYMFYFGKVGGGTPSQPVPFSVPNEAGLPPGDKAALWYYDESPVPGVAPNDWRMAGLGTVSDDGLTLATDPGVGIPRFCCGAVIWARRQASELANATSQLFEDVLAADPVDMANGVFMLRVTDLVLPGRIPVSVKRTYRSGDVKVGAFGRGATGAYADVLPLTAPGVLTYVYAGRAQTPFFLQPDGTYANNMVPAFKGTRITMDPVTGARAMRHRDGTVIEFNYAGLMTAIRDRNGNQVSIGRTHGVQPDRITDPSGRLLSFAKSGDLVTSVTDPAGRIVRYVYDGFARLTRVIQADGSTTDYAYDALHRMTSITDGRGIAYLRNTYDVNGRVCLQEQADGGRFTFYYVTTDIASAFQNIGLQQQAAAGGPVTQTPCSATLAPGRVIATVLVDPRGHPTTYRFNGSGSVVSTTDALGRTTSFERDGSNQIVASVDPLGRRTQYQYDGRGNLTRTTDPAGHVRQFTYDPVFSNVTRIADPLGNAITLEYDTSGNLTAITDAEQNLEPAGQRLKTTIAYDAFGQPVTVTDPLGQTATAAYDPFGNVVTITDTSGAVTSRTYDNISRLERVADARGGITLFQYDPLGRVTRILDAFNGATGFGYDANGNLVTLQDARGNTTSYAFDAMDRVVGRTDPLGRSDSFSYDTNGNLVQTTDRKGQSATYLYDSVNRPTEINYANGATVRYELDAADRLVRVRDSAGGELLNGYDLLDRLVATTTDLGSVFYSYDAAGRKTSMRAAGQPLVTYVYDAGSRLRQVTRGTDVTSMSYDALNRRTRLTLPNGVSTEYRYDVGSRISELVYTNPGVALGNLTYQYDSAGNRRGVGGSLARTLLPDPVDAAAYDAANRQVEFGSRTMTYDFTGNLTSIARGTELTSLAWDSRHRLTGITGAGAQAAFTYDPLGRRRSRQINGQLTRTLFDGLTPVVELSGTAAHSVLAGPGLDEPWVRNGSEFVLADALGSVVGLTNASGALTTRYAYDPFGTTTVEGPASTNAVQFTARENDGTGLYYYRARYYSPELKRFISEDPLGFDAGDTNVYAYVSNSPVDATDPLGLEKTAAGAALDLLAEISDEAAKLKKVLGVAQFFDEFGKCGKAKNATGHNKTFSQNITSEPFGSAASKFVDIVDCGKQGLATMIPELSLYSDAKRWLQKTMTPAPSYPRAHLQNGVYYWETSPGVFTHYAYQGAQTWTPLTPRR